MKELEVPVVGMGCSHCVNKINKEVMKLAGVVSVKIDLEGGRFKLTFDQTQVGIEQVRAAVQRAGYDLDLRSVGTPASPPQPTHDCAQHLSGGQRT